MTLLAPVLACAALAIAHDDGQTVVRARASDDADLARVAPPTLGDDKSLLLVPGVALAREGGPLAPSRPLLRGLSGARLDVDVIGLPMVDPAAGAFDVGLLPWGLGDAVIDVGAGDAVGGALSIRRPAPGIDVAVGAGDLSTLRGRARVAGSIEGGRVLAFVEGGTTRGDFVFVNDDTLGTGGPDAVRRNNDQQRVNAAGAADVDLVPGVARVVVSAAAGLRRGGVPGFATAPLLLRAEDALGAVGGQVDSRVGPARVALGVDGTASDRAISGGGRDSRVVGTRAGVVGEARVRGAERGDAVDGALHLRFERAVADTVGAASAADGGVRDELRGSADARARANVAELAFTLAISGGGSIVVDRDAISDARVALLPRGRLRLSAGATDDALLAFVGLARSARAPTLDERYAPRGFILGNPALRPESIDELEVGAVVALPAARARVVGHASALHDVIVVVNRNAFELAPENTGEALRAGVDVGVTLRPLPLFSLDLSASLLATALTATGAPLPGAPPVVLACAPRVGDERAYVSALVAARGPVASTIFGTGTSPGSVLVDAHARVPLGAGLAAVLALQNAFDVRDARDQNLLPLPGRLLFVSLEVHA